MCLIGQAIIQHDILVSILLASVVFVLLAFEYMFEKEIPIAYKFAISMILLTKSIIVTMCGYRFLFSEWFSTSIVIYLLFIRSTQFRRRNKS